MATRKAIVQVKHTEQEHRFRSKRAPEVKYADDIANYICEQIAMGRSLLSVCREEGMPTAAAVIYWANINLCGFTKKYETAIGIRAQLHFEELISIADDASEDYVTRERADGSEYEAFNPENVQRAKLRVETRKWELSKMIPKKFGDAQLIKLGDNEGNKILAPTIVVQPVQTRKEG
jgi:hypothetical protein